MNKQKRGALINIIAFQALWFLCVMANDVLALFALILFCLLHHFFVLQKIKEWLLVLVFASLGFVADSVLQSLQVIQFTHAIELTEQISIAPVWMACLWLAFSTSLVHGLFWLHERIRLSVFIGFFVVPFSYYAGLLLSGSTAIEPMWISLFWVGTIWSVLLPTGLFLAKKMGLVYEQHS